MDAHAIKQEELEKAIVRAALHGEDIRSIASHLDTTPRRVRQTLRQPHVLDRLRDEDPAIAKQWEAEASEVSIGDLRAKARQSLEDVFEAHQALIQDANTPHNTRWAAIQGMYDIAGARKADVEAAQDAGPTLPQRQLDVLLDTLALQQDDEGTSTG